MNELYNDLYQRMNGFKPIRRDSKKKGATDWYYLDPRDAETISDMQQIDVTSENVANPKIKEIVAYDMAENPENYYIWRTCKDDKVRGAHAEREGKIYNKYIPPEGGNPGEDYNCRCWAEPYQSQRTRQPDDVAKVDLSGLPQFAKSDRKNGVESVSIKNTPSEKYLSQDFFDLLGFKESSSDYTKYYNDKEGIGAIGMYQFRKPALQEIGYIDKEGKWVGKDGIFSVNDLRYNPQIQEKAVREFADRNYKYMQSYKVLSYLGQRIAGKAANFTITISGMLAASHKEGGPMTAIYLKSLEKNKEGLYYLPYKKYHGNILRSFLAIETRLREFAEVDHK